MSCDNFCLQVKDNAAAIKDLNNAETPDNVQQQLDQINADLTALQSRVTALEGPGSGNLDTRVSMCGLFFCNIYFVLFSGNGEWGSPVGVEVAFAGP